MIPNRLENLGDRVSDALIDTGDHLAILVKESWRSEIAIVGAIDTGAYLQSPLIETVMRSNDHLTKTITSSVGYGDIVERGRTDADYPGRYPAKRGIEKAQIAVENAIDKTVRENL